VLGIDCNIAHLEQATRAAAGLSFRTQAGELDRKQALPRADTVLIVDVLYQLRSDAQRELLRQAARAARHRVLVRTLDPRRGLRSAFTLTLERVFRRIAPNSGGHVNPLPLDVLAHVLESEGFAVVAAPCWQGTPFANVLLSAIRLLPQRVDQSGEAVVVAGEEGVVVAADGEAQAGALGDHVYDS
jgi:hypothetical protein